jgi:hypothetical protein
VKYTLTSTQYVVRFTTKSILFTAYRAALGPTQFRDSIDAAESLPESKVVGAVKRTIQLHLALNQINFHSSILLRGVLRNTFTFKTIPLQGLGRPLGLQMVEPRRISKLSPHECGDVSHTHRPPLTPGNIPGTHFCLIPEP